MYMYIHESSARHRKYCTNNQLYGFLGATLKGWDWAIQSSKCNR